MVGIEGILETSGKDEYIALENIVTFCTFGEG